MKRDVVVEFRSREYRSLPRHATYEYTDTKTRAFAWIAAIFIMSVAVGTICVVVPISSGVQKQLEWKRILESPQHDGKG